MSLSSLHLQQLYQGYLETNLLWKSNPLNGLVQFETTVIPSHRFNRLITRKLRLGQLAEQFVFHQLERTQHCRIIAENLQIQSEKTTIGELDALIKLEDQLYHVEVVYKFYLFDDSLGDSEIEKWIGPNRNDSLVEKLDKLSQKQLPLLYSSESKMALKQLNIQTGNIQQKVIFKAQLFSPYNTEVTLNQLNETCLSGFYLKRNDLKDFSHCVFYIPPKLDWFLRVHNDVDWLIASDFKSQADLFLTQQKSPLIWIRKPDNSLLKCFLVWW